MPVAIPGLPRTATSIVDLIGNTPLIRLSQFEAGLRNVELYAKAEWKNPGGSVKDRPALRMIQDGERSGALTRGRSAAAEATITPEQQIVVPPKPMPRRRKPSALSRGEPAKTA